jgi:hypothetical protein
VRAIHGSDIIHCRNASGMVTEFRHPCSARMHQGELFHSIETMTRPFMRKKLGEMEGTITLGAFIWLLTCIP